MDNPELYESLDAFVANNIVAHTRQAGINLVGWGWVASYVLLVHAA